MDVPCRAPAIGVMVAEGQVDPGVSETSTTRVGSILTVSQFVPASDNVVGVLQSGFKSVVMRDPTPEAKDKDVKVFPPKTALKVPQTRPYSAVVNDKHIEEISNKQTADDIDTSETSGKRDIGRPPSSRARHGKAGCDKATDAASRKSHAYTPSQGLHYVDTDDNDRPSTASTQGGTSSDLSMVQARSLVSDPQWTSR